ncbi:androgen-dependent TFPI-regulating protein-like isoform X2 [Anthonomus grandis grandis]|uniref:androgen-dependent TFPI-regulating protein-like isoform X2 n=1 Tax=Anthonomus grandis grandis TaxID=2921223 RepID=UPI0021660EB5|nr:androgen-dependent TFPI-regulating protein-like isoform X2 [Anthonomus grandis grandis]
MRKLALPVYLAILVFYLYSLKVSVQIRRNVSSEQLMTELKKSEKFQNVTKDRIDTFLKDKRHIGLLFFTLWTFVLQIAFLLIAVTDELTKFFKFTNTQKRIERARKFFFSTLVFPSSLLVASVFWTIWHVDRELIFPKIIDTFYPSWLNHTLHTFILLPLLIETVIHFKSAYSNLSRTRALLILLIYVTVYQTLYLSVYFQHGVWLYPIYKVLTWNQRIIFTLSQLFLAISYQQIGISLMKRDSGLPKTKLK